MIAMVSALHLETGDVAYPIAYFSMEDTPPAKLHQPWLRQDLWFKTETGDASWLIANDDWDFDLASWVARNQLWWVAERDGKFLALSAESGEICPYLDISGERRPQTITGGSRTLGDPPTGVPFDPFAD